MSNIDNQALDIDLYQARMLIAFYKAGMKDVRGTMEAFTRKLPASRKFLVNCGVERIVAYLKQLKITDISINILKQVLPEIEFDDDLCNYLKSIDFAKEIVVHGMDDGEICFAQQPVIALTGPVGIIQYPEKKILSILNHDIRIASKAARIYIAAQGRPVAEFGGRRGPDNMSAEAGRAAYIAGFSSSSNVLAFARYGVPCSGTMGHIFVMSYLDDKDGSSGEERAYRDWGKIFKDSAYLPDTYNLRNGVDKVIRNCRKNVGAIRLDVDRLKEESINVRRQLNQMDHFDTKIGATNDLNEYKIKELIEYGCPIDWFGVGTEVVSTPDAPTCNFIYKLVDVDDPIRGHQMVAKISDGSKGTYPGAKQVFRHYSDNLHLGLPYRKFCFDEIGLIDEESKHSSYKLLRPFSLINNSIGPSATTSRSFFLSNLEKLPDEIKLIEKDEFNSYPVVLSKLLQEATTIFKSKKL